MVTTVLAGGIAYLGGGTFAHASVRLEGGIITDVGPSAAVAREPSAADVVVDVRGCTIVPGFQDAHVHPLLAGLALSSIDLSGVHDRAAYLRIVAAYATEHPTLPALTGGGWFGDVFEGGFPTATELDEVLPDRPVLLLSHDAHGMWVNTAALRAAGIDGSTPDPPGGRIVRRGDGTPTGMLLEGAVSLVSHLEPKPDAASLERALLAAQSRLNAVGVTAWQDAVVGASDIGPDALPAYESLDATGRLHGRVVLAQWWDRARGLEQIDDMRAVRDRVAGSERLDAGTVKVMLDGMVENHTACMLAPLTGTDGDKGISFISPEDAATLTTALDANGFQVHYHAVGDGAVRNALDAVEAARAANGPRGNRHHIAHLDVVDPADIPRFAELDVTANVTGLWARRDEEILTRKLPLLGAERARHHFPFGSLARAGARVVGGSDWPVTDPNPLWSIRTAVTRTGIAEDPHAIGPGVLTEPLLADEAVDLGAALDAYTTHAAYINRLEGSRGSVRPGAVADLAIIDADLRDIGAYGSARVRATLIAGSVVHGAL